MAGATGAFAAGMLKSAVKRIFSFRQERDQHAVAVGEVLDVVQLDRPGAALEDLAVAGALEFGLPVRFGERVPDQRPRVVERLLEKVLVVLVRDNGDALGRKRRRPLA